MFPSDTDYDAKVTLEVGAIPSPDDQPFHILLLGDWSGKESRADESDSFDLTPIEIDRDNFDEALRKMGVRLDLNFQSDRGDSVIIDFNKLEDFHPDKIFQRLPLFAELRDVRQRLLSSKTFDAAAAEVRSWFAEAGGENEIEAQPQNAAIKSSEVVPNDLLDHILAQADKESSDFQNQNNESSALTDFVKKLVKPHLLETDAAERSNLLLVIDEIISDLMRKILHHPQFQALEAAWRGAFFVVRRVETASNLKIYLLDVSKSILASGLKSINDLIDSNLYKFFASSDNSWSVICGNYTFSLNVDDVATLIRLAKIADHISIPFISHVKPQMFGCETFEEMQNTDDLRVVENSAEEKLWTMLRAMPEAECIGLAMPRFLIRLPYGEQTDPAETFYFEESTGVIQHEEYLWTNPIFAGALLLAQTFTAYGWNISQNFFQDIDGLPVHLYQDGHENKVKPCAEILMTQSKCEKILEQGLMPLISFRDTDRIRFVDFQSVAYPLTSLKGRWK